jgi:hypothetical protein
VNRPGLLQQDKQVAPDIKCPLKVESSFANDNRHFIGEKIKLNRKEKGNEYKRKTWEKE